MTTTIVDEILAHATIRPTAPAIVTSDTVITYREFAARTDRLARVLVASGVGAEHVCAIAVRRGPDVVVAMAAILRAGAAFLTLDVELPGPRLQAMVSSGQARCLITTPSLAAQLRLPVDGPMVYPDAPQPANMVDLPAIAARSLAYVSHTSGSTGPPNAVLIEHRGLDNYLRFVVRDYDLNPETVVLQLAPFGYDASIRDTFAPLVAGGRLVLLPRSTLLRPDEFVAALRTYRVDAILSATPTFLTSVSGGYLPLRLVVSSGESLRPFLAAGGRARLSGRLVNQYGPTEATMTSTRYTVAAAPDTTADVIGTPIDGVRVHLLDTSLEQVADGTTGEVWIGGLGVTRGYGGRPALTAARFVPDPFGRPGERMYRTGDLARRRPDGNLEYLGRVDRQIKIRGYRVDPAEIEGALLAHPAVTGAVVVTATDDRGRTFLTAHITGTLTEVADAALRAFLASTLPPYMMPRRFVRIDRLPTTASGKADRRALAAGPR